MSFWSRPMSPLAAMSSPFFDIHECRRATYNMLALEMHFPWVHDACVKTQVAWMDGRQEFSTIRQF
jgi:hypothetical protein